MSRLTAPLFVAIILQGVLVANSAPGHYHDGYVSGGFSGGISADFGGISHGIRSIGHRINNHFDRVAGAIGDFTGGLRASFEKTYHVPKVQYETRYVKVRTPVVYKVEKKVYKQPASTFSGGFSAAYDKNVDIRIPEVKYEPRYVEVEKPVEYHERVIDEPHNTHGFSGGFQAKFEKNVNVKAPEVHHDVKYVKTYEKPVEYHEEKEVEIPYKTFEFSANVEKNVDVKSHEVKPETKQENNKPVEYHEEVVNAPHKTAQASGAFAVNFEKNIGVQLPEVKHENTHVTVEEPIVYHEEEIGDILRKEIGFSATVEKNVKKENSPVEYEAPHHAEADARVEHHEIENVDKTADFIGGINIDIRKNGQVPVQYHQEHIHETEHVPVVKDFNHGFVATGSVDVKVDKHYADHHENDEHAKVIGVELVKAFSPVKSSSVNVDVRKTFSSSDHDEHSDKDHYVQKVKTGDASVKVEAPFTSVGVRKDIHGSVDVGVKAPFTQVATSKHEGHKEVSVVAPFTSVHTVKAGASKAVQVKAPFVDVQTGHQGDVRVKAPFVDVYTGPKDIHGKASVQIKLPFFNLHL